MNLIPMEIDAVQIINELNVLGWNDYKLEIALGYSKGYIGQLRCGNIEHLSYSRGARLHNFWVEEIQKNTKKV